MDSSEATDQYQPLRSVNEALEWAAAWIEGSLAGEIELGVIEFAHNMAASIRAGKIATDEPGPFEIARLDLRPGDVLVLRSPEPLSQATVARITAFIENKFPGHKAIVLENGLSLGVMNWDVGLNDARTQATTDG
jgi:hypothetical protein